MKTSIPAYQYLMNLRKADMQDIAEMFDEKLPDSWKKERMAQRLMEIYEQTPRAFLPMFSFPVITFLQMIFEKQLNGKLKAQEVQADSEYGYLSQFYDQLEYMGLIDYSNGKITVPGFLGGGLLNDSALNDDQLSDWQDMEYCALGILDVYGMLEEHHFLRIFHECYPEFSTEEAYLFLTHRIEFRMQSYCIGFDDGFRWFSGMIDNSEEWYFAMKSREDMPYRKYTREEYINFAIYGYSRPPKNYDRLSALLRKSGMSADEAETELEEEILAHRSQLQPRFGMPDFIERLCAERTLAEAQKLFDLYRDFCNDIPIWLNKGHTSAELSRFGRSVLEKPRLLSREGEGLAATAPPRPNNVIPFPGAAVIKKQPGYNDPCPCGSGKKYKNCCGKDKDDK